MIFLLVGVYAEGQILTYITVKSTAPDIRPRKLINENCSSQVFSALQGNLTRILLNYQYFQQW